MKKERDQFFQTLAGVAAVLARNASHWEKLPDFKLQVDRLSEKMNLIRELGALHARDAAGITVTKQERLERLIDSALAVAGLIKAHALIVGDAELKAAFHHTRSQLRLRAAANLPGKVNAILTWARAHEDVLAGTGLTKGMLDNLELRRDAFLALAQGPAEARKSRRLTRERIEEEIASIRTLLTGFFDPAMYQFAEPEPGFYRSYRAARELVRYPTRSRFDAMDEADAIEAEGGLGVDRAGDRVQEPASASASAAATGAEGEVELVG